MFDMIIAGAGIIGAATAYQLLKKNPNLKLLILEKENEPALHQTGRNSGVVHSGIYYKPGSLKAKNCIEGRAELLSFCDAQGIHYQKKHKLIIATKKEELPQLQKIFSRGQANGISGLKLLSKEQVSEIEPHAYALQAILIPECHIINYAEVVKALCSSIEKRGGKILYNEPVLEIQKSTVIGKQNHYQTRFFINCTGLYSDRIARSSKEKIDHQIIPFRGEYYELIRKNFVHGLIYPVPDPKFPFLGVHLTPMMNGKIEAGPNAVLALSREGYRKTDFNWADVREIFTYKGFWKMSLRNFNSGIYEIMRSFSKNLFLRDLRQLVPTIEADDLQPAGAGIRAQAVTQDGKLFDDFAFLQKENALHVLNAPSPAATASFAIGRTLAEMAFKETSCTS